MTKKSRQKFKYLESEKSFYDETKSIFHHFKRALSDVNKKCFLQGESPTLKVRVLKLGSHRGDELRRPPSSPVINLVGTIEGSSPNLHRRR